jgi:hypothetical protein
MPTFDLLTVFGKQLREDYGGKFEDVDLHRASLNELMASSDGRLIVGLLNDVYSDPDVDNNRGAIGEAFVFQIMRDRVGVFPNSDIEAQFRLATRYRFSGSFPSVVNSRFDAVATNDSGAMVVEVKTSVDSYPDRTAEQMRAHLLDAAIVEWHLDLARPVWHLATYDRSEVAVAFLEKQQVYFPAAVQRMVGSDRLADAEAIVGGCV